MTHKAKSICIVLAVATFAIPMIFANAAQAGVQFTLAYTSAPADVRVWLERGNGQYGYEDEYDVYDSVEDVALYVRAARSCYATVYVVDTEGYIHIVHPLSPADRGYLRGGRVYKIYLSEMGFGQAFGAGIAYAYAVSSPVPFDYGHFGIDAFGARCGYRIYGDPYVAARFFYVDLVGGRCDIALIGVSHARFYIGSYVRYPRYLCPGWHDHYGVRTWCRERCEAYRYYAIHARDPFCVLHPQRELRPYVRGYTHVASAQDRRPGVRFKGEDGRTYPSRVERRTVVDRNDDLRPLSREKKTIVKSSRETFVRGKTDLTELRREFERRGRKNGGEPKAAERPKAKVHKAVSVGGSTNRSGGVKKSESSASRGVKSSTKQKSSSKTATSKTRGKK